MTTTMSSKERAVSKQIKVNRAKLLSILKTVVLCGKQNTPLRGHRDDSRYLSSDSSHKCGNFQALLDFRTDVGDNVLKQHLKLLNVMQHIGRKLYKMSS